MVTKPKQLVILGTHKLLDVWEMKMTCIIYSHPKINEFGRWYQVRKPGVVFSTLYMADKFIY